MFYLESLVFAEMFHATGKIFLSQKLNRVKQTNKSMYPYLCPVNTLYYV